MSPWNPWDFDGIDEDTVPIEIDAKDARRIFDDRDFCYHDWAEYVGLRERFEWCKVCNKKREIIE